VKLPRIKSTVLTRGTKFLAPSIVSTCLVHRKKDEQSTLLGSNIRTAAEIDATASQIASLRVLLTKGEPLKPSMPPSQGVSIATSGRRRIQQGTLRWPSFVVVSFVAAGTYRRCLTLLFRSVRATVAAAALDQSLPSPASSAGESSQ